MLSQQEKELGEGAVAGVGFSPEVWEQLDRMVRGLGVPSNLKYHKARHGPHGDMPDTGGDVFLHVKSKTYGLAFETVRAFVNSLPRGSVAKVEDGYSFTFQTNRDLTGFIGTSRCLLIVFVFPHSYQDAFRRYHERVWGGGACTACTHHWRWPQQRW